MQFIFELPTRLNNCLSQEKYTDAVRYHFRTANLFEHYFDLAVFQGLDKECKAIMRKITEKIKQSLTTDKVFM